MDASRSDESSALISQLREEVAYLREENLRKDHIIAGLVERIPPAIETSSEARESPESATEQPGRVGPSRPLRAHRGAQSPGPGGGGCSVVDKEERQEPLEALDALELKLQSLKQQSLELQKQSLQQQLERLGADKEERRREALKLQFEQLKHISTLSGALAVIELGLYSAQLVSAVFWLAISLVVLGLSVYWCVFQMNLLSVDMEFGQPPTSYWGPAIGWVLFLNGLVYLLLQAVPPLSLPILVFLLVLVVTITAIAGYWWIRKLKALNRSLSHRADPASEEGTEDREEHTESPQEPA